MMTEDCFDGPSPLDARVERLEIEVKSLRAFVLRYEEGERDIAESIRKWNDWDSARWGAVLGAAK